MFDCPSAYNAILRRPMLNQMKVVTSTYHLLLHFLTEEGVREVMGDQVVARECYVALLKGDLNPKETMSIDSLEVETTRPRQWWSRGRNSRALPST